MKNPFAVLAKPFVWLAKEVLKTQDWFKKLVTLTDDVTHDAHDLLPQLELVVEDVDQLVVAAVKDAGESITTLEGLIASVVLAAEQGGMNFASDSAVVANFQAFCNTIKADGNFHEFMVAVRKLVQDYGQMKGTVRTAIQRLEGDLRAENVVAIDEQQTSTLTQQAVFEKGEPDAGSEEAAGDAAPDPTPA